MRNPFFDDSPIQNIEFESHVERNTDTKKKIKIIPLHPGGSKKFNAQYVNVPVVPPKKNVATPKDFIFFAIVMYVMYKIYKFLEHTKPE